MRDWRKSKLLLAFLLILSLVAAACGGDDEDEPAAVDDTDTTEDTSEVPEGGTLTIGAEQEPDCVDWIASCAGSSWGYWTMNVTTLPRAYNVVKDGENWVYEPSNLLEGEAELETDPQQKVTYKINPEAKWSDGTPITSKDFKYTWEQITTGEDIYDKTGYENIESIETPDDHTVVATFSENFADWKSLFGGGYGILPAHILEGKNRSEIMANGYDFSGGPWKIETWDKGNQIVLVPNENYWGEQPKLDRVVFKVLPDTAAEFQAFKGGQVSMIYPQPQLDVVDQINSGLTGAKSQFSATTGNLEAVWFHNGKPPFDNEDFRKAVAYALDRDAIVERLFGGLGIKQAMQTLNAPIVSQFADEDAFANYTQNMDKVAEHMKAAGFTKGSNGMWMKNGQPASFTIKSTTGNKRRELTEQIMQEQLKEAGIEMKIANQAAGDLFGDQLPKGDYEASLYAWVLTTPYPSLCNVFCSSNIPSEANNFSGTNWQRVNIPALDKHLQTVQNSLDEEEAQKAGREADRIMAENMISLPLDPLPNILLWSEDVVGPVEDNPVMGPFFRMHEWGTAG